MSLCARNADLVLVLVWLNVGDAKTVLARFAALPQFGVKIVQKSLLRLQNVLKRTDGFQFEQVRPSDLVLLYVEHFSVLSDVLCWLDGRIEVDVYSQGSRSVNTSQKVNVAFVKQEIEWALEVWRCASFGHINFECGHRRFVWVDFVKVQLVNDSLPDESLLVLYWLSHYDLKVRLSFERKRMIILRFKLKKEV